MSSMMGDFFKFCGLLGIFKLYMHRHGQETEQFAHSGVGSDFDPRPEISCSGPVHRGAICQVLFRLIYYCHSSESTRKKNGKTHLCAVWGRISKKKMISSCLGTCLVNDYKTFFFSHAHSGLHRPGKQKTVKSSQIRSKATMPWYSCRVVTKFFLYHQGRRDR